MSATFQQFIKPGKNLVIELEEVEYLLNGESLEAIERENGTIPLVRLYDKRVDRIAIEKIEAALMKDGPVDYLDL
jgi:hypothetical protein